MTPKRKALRTIKTILVPTDFSDYSEKALSRAVSLAKMIDAKIVVVHVIDTLNYFVTESLQWGEVFARLRGAAQPMLTRLVREAEKKGVGAKSDLIQGVPYEQIVKKAEKLRAGLIVMGTHGRAGMRHLFLGSVAERVIRLAPCPVMTVGEGEEKP